MVYKDKEKERAWRRAYMRAKYASDPTMKEYQQTYRIENKDKYAEYQRNQRARRPREALVCQAKGRAKKFGLPCDLTVEALHWPTHCPILGLELDYNKTNPGERKIRHSVPTLDRKTNALGYVLGNVFVISHRANWLKSDATAEELEAVLAYMRA